MEEKILQIHVDEISQMKQAIVGHVILTVAEQLEMFCLTVSLTGVGTIQPETRRQQLLCVKNSPDKSHSLHLHKRSCEMYIRDKKYLVGDPTRIKISIDEDEDVNKLDGLPITVIKLGVHKYQFEFYLPEHLPSSFDGGNCSVEYFLEAVIFTPRPKVKHSLKEISSTVPITIRGNLDLNCIPEINGESEGTKTRQTSCILVRCCSKNSVDLTVSLRRRGYVCGEYVPFIFHTVNHSGRRIIKTEAKLVQYILTYPLEEHELYTKKDVVIKTVKKSKEECTRSEDVWVATIEIPVDAPISHLGGSRIIDVQYGLQIFVTLSGCIKLKVWVEVPILVGTIPLRKPNLRPSMLELSVGSGSVASSVEHFLVGDSMRTWR